jgi:hypothetical protein
VVVAETDTAGDGSVIDSSFALVAYSDANVTTAVFSEYAATATGFTNLGSAIYTNAPLTLSGSGGSVQISTLSIGSPCKDVPNLTNPFGADTGNYPSIEYAPSVCRLTTFRAAMATTFTATAGLDPALQAIAIAPQSVNGIRLLNYRVYEQRLRQALAGTRLRR